MSKLNHLTGLRFIAAYIVVLSHIFGSGSFALNEMGGVSVQLFFVLSGFVMYINYAQKIVDKQINFVKYFKLRLIRLYPVYFLSILLYLVFSLRYANISNYYKPFLVNVFMLQSWIGDMGYAFSPLNAPSCSVSDEMFFYLAFYIVLKFGKSAKPAIFLMLSYCIIWYVMIYYLRNGLSLLSFKWLYYINPLYRISDFFIGGIVGYIYIKKLQFLKITRNYLVLFFQLLVLISVYASQYILPLDKFWFSSVLVALMCGLCIMGLSLNSNNLFTKILSNKLMVLLGESSYSLYLFHFLVLFMILAPFMSSHVSSLNFIILQLTIPIVFSILVYKLYEQPIYIFLKSKVK